MLRSLKDLASYKVSAVDGEVGAVTDFLFDDQHWTTRYLITDTGGFWSGPNRVLISPLSFRQIDWEMRLFHVGLTQDKVKHSPSVDLDLPVSRQYEREYSQYYGWPYYWGFAGTWAWGAGAYPLALKDSSNKAAPKRPEETDDDPHLRSVKAVTGYHVNGRDGEIGHIEDFIVDDETWTIRYLVVDTSNWWFGKKVLVAPHWAHRISWSESMVYLALTKDQIKNSPEWKPTEPVNREYEARLYDYYGHPTYWPRNDSNLDTGDPPKSTKHQFL